MKGRYVCPTCQARLLHQAQVALDLVADRSATSAEREIAEQELLAALHHLRGQEVAS